MLIVISGIKPFPSHHSVKYDCDNEFGKGASLPLFRLLSTYLSKVLKSNHLWEYVIDSMFSLNAAK
jgi:hypothetical protein